MTRHVLLASDDAKAPVPTAEPVAQVARKPPVGDETNGDLRAAGEEKVVVAELAPKDDTTEEYEYEDEDGVLDLTNSQIHSLENVRVREGLEEIDLTSNRFTEVDDKLGIPTGIFHRPH